MFIKFIPFIVMFFTFSCQKNTKPQSQLISELVLEHCVIDQPWCNLKSRPIDTIGTIQSVLDHGPNKFFIANGFTDDHFSETHINDLSNYANQEIGEFTLVTISKIFKGSVYNISENTFYIDTTRNKSTLKQNLLLSKNESLGYFQFSSIRYSKQNETAICAVQYNCGNLCYCERVFKINCSNTNYSIISSKNLYPNRIY